jgi:hypothetical protein
MNVHPLVAAFLALWVGVVSGGFSLSFFHRLASGEQGALGPGAMILFAVLLTAGGFYPEAFKAERIVRRALQAAA